MLAKKMSSMAFTLSLAGIEETNEAKEAKVAKVPRGYIEKEPI